MKRCWMRLLAMLLCLTAVLAGTALAADMGMMPPDGMGPPPDGGPGGGGAPPGDGAPTAAAIVITDGAEDTAAEYEPGAYSDLISQQDGALVIEGLDLSSGDYTFNGLVATGPDSVVRLQKANIRLGVDQAATDDDKGGSATNIDNGATLYISDSNLVVDGAARYVTANYNDATLIVNNSTVESTGSNDQTAAVSEPFSNAALLISGTARANFSIGATKTYYFNSTCMAEGWAALSTDSATGDGLDLYAYNTDGIAENGGYSTYADTNCRVWLYGSRMTAAEIGCIISKSGQIHVYNAQAAGDDVMAYNEGETVNADSSILGGRNAVMIHAPDMMGQGLYAADCGTFTAEDTTMATTRELVSTKDYNDYGEATGAYIDYVSGSVFLIRSTSANIDLKNVKMESYNNTLIQTVLNADSMGNFLKPGDGDQVNPIAVTMTDMDVTGDIRHEDYQRRMTVTLENATLGGGIDSFGMDHWNRTWAGYGDVNWVVDESYDTQYGVELIVGKDATWYVTRESTLSSLTIDEGGKVEGGSEMAFLLDGEPLEPEPGVTYTGNIVVKGSYDPAWEGAEETEGSALEQAAPEEAAEAPEATQAPAEVPEAEASQAETAPEAPAESGSSNTVVIVVIVVLAVAAAAVIIAAAVKKKRSK